MNPKVEAFFDKDTFTVTYVVAESSGSHCAIIDSVLNYDAKSGRTSTHGADKVIEYVRGNELTVDWILETHAHADHLSAAPYLKEILGGYTAIGEYITTVQGFFKEIFHVEPDFPINGSQFDQLFCDGEMFHIGALKAHVLHTPGHTPACVTYIIGDAAFVGDTLFMPDYGTARTDFPGGDAATLYRSIQKVLALPEDTRLFVCHDYMAPGRDSFAWETNVAEERKDNIHVRDSMTEDEFVALRTDRDKQLDMPALLLPSVQVNMRAGNFPPAEENGTHFLKIPLDTL